jgi:NADP-dependent 3-hydroxy acid dehydrogenase YdfG
VRVVTASNTPPAEQPQKEREGQMLTAEDLARSVLYALQQPPRCDVILIQIRPHGQAI